VSGFRPTGGQFRLRAGDAEAVVTAVGGGLRRLRWAGRDLVAGFAAGQLRPVYRGSVLAPWANRLADGRYRWDGAEHQLPLTEPERRTALHGLVVWQAWTPVRVADAEVALATRLHPQPGYPFQLDLTVTYRLDPDGLEWRLEAVNSGGTDAPYGCSVHPYLVAGPGRVDDWTFSLPAERWLEVDPERLLPVGLRDVAGTAFDLRAPRRLGAVEVDHAFTGLVTGPDGRVRAELRGPDGAGVALEWAAAELPWVQVHTADRPAEPDLHRAGLAVEPMTAPPDALASGQDVVRLRPGDRHAARWSLRRL
jgi:aldose 1-epimerase